ncbi:MAG: hypothetical protein M3463_14985 [Verrucomicrobiota bacterium]|nr:hypothetical protein [Verrucomicrobiota bacterium]
MSTSTRNEEDIFTVEEVESGIEGTLDEKVTNQEVVFVRDSEGSRKIHFYTIFDEVGEIEVKLLKDGSDLLVTERTLEPDLEFAELIDHVSARIASLELPGIEDGPDVEDLAEIIQERLDALDPNDVNYEITSKHIGESPQFNKDWNGKGFWFFKRLSDLTDDLGNVLSAQGMIGFTRFYGSILDDAGDYYQTMARLFTDNSTLARNQLNAVMEQFGDAAAGFKMARAGGKAWRSPAGLVYDVGSQHEHHVLHVFAHTVPDPSKPIHTVFSVPREEILPLIDQAWLQRGAHTVHPSSGNWNYRVDMGFPIGNGGEHYLLIAVEPARLVLK